MLTKTDLQNIGTLVDQKLELKLNSKLTPIRKDISNIKKDIKGIRGDFKVMSRLFDNDYLTLKKKVIRIEDHIKLPPISQ